MYKSDEVGSIWVTLCKLEWSWGGTATKDAQGQWSKLGVGHSSKDPKGVDSTELPTWSATGDSIFPPGEP